MNGNHHIYLEVVHAMLQCYYYYLIRFCHEQGSFEFELNQFSISIFVFLLSREFSHLDTVFLRVGTQKLSFTKGKQKSRTNGASTFTNGYINPTFFALLLVYCRKQCTSRFSHSHLLIPIWWSGFSQSGLLNWFVQLIFY